MNADLLPRPSIAPSAAGASVVRSSGDRHEQPPTGRVSAGWSGLERRSGSAARPVAGLTSTSGSPRGPWHPGRLGYTRRLLGTAAPPDVRIAEVTKRFGDVVAVDNLSLEVPHGSFFALLGPSGCGKTTTVRMIGVLEAPTAGAGLLGHRDVTQLPPPRRAADTAFQHPA